MSSFFFNVQGSVDHNHPRAKQPIRQLNEPQRPALTPPLERQNVSPRKETTPKTSIPSWAWESLTQPSVSRKHQCRLLWLKRVLDRCQMQHLHERHFSFSSSGSGWVANFGEVNSKAPAAGAGFSAWGSPDCQPAATEVEEKGWAKFTDFQPFCWWVVVVGSSTSRCPVSLDQGSSTFRSLTATSWKLHKPFHIKKWNNTAHN